ncbi:MAG: Holliday junction resolvase RuvX [Chloroflexi bacterium]|nr:Holliday junction resolvase RuvX [Chloroflexota bacterium]
MRIIGIDLGERRIGVAAADDRTGVAVPVDTVEAGDDVVQTVAQIALDQRADEVVVGLPLSMSGAVGPQAEGVLKVVDELREKLSITVHTWDERLTTVQAGRGGGGRSRSGATSRDALAAAILLQTFIDSRRSV